MEELPFKARDDSMELRGYEARRKENPGGEHSRLEVRIQPKNPAEKFVLPMVDRRLP
jgi:hypothetical protein